MSYCSGGCDCGCCCRCFHYPSCNQSATRSVESAAGSVDVAVMLEVMHCEAYGDDCAGDCGCDSAAGDDDCDDRGSYR